MEVHGQDAICAGGFEHVGDEPGGNGDARLVFLIAAAVGVVGDDGGDAARGGPLGGIDHDEQLHDGGVHRAGERLHQVDILHADVLLVLDEDVFVGELEH